VMSYRQTTLQLYKRFLRAGQHHLVYTSQVYYRNKVRDEFKKVPYNLTDLERKQLEEKANLFLTDDPVLGGLK